MHAVAERLANQREANKFAILIPVAPPHAVLARLREHGEQLRLGAGLEADAIAATLKQRIDDALLLIDLDRINRGVLALVVVGRGRGVEGLAQLLHAVMQD